jgi:cytochrome b
MTKDKFIEHAALIWRQEGVTVEQARFMAWGEGPAGYIKRLKAEQDGERHDI